MFHYKINSLLFGGITLLLSFFPLLAWSQVGITTISSDLEVCGLPDTFQVTITNQGSNALTNINIVLELAEGISYTPGSVDGPGVSEQSIPSPDSIMLASQDIPAFQDITFLFTASAGCSASDSAAIFNTLIVNSSNGADTVNSVPFDIEKPALSILNISPSSVTDTLGGSFSRCVEIVNGGIGPLSTFQFAIQVDTARLQYSNFAISPSTAIAPVYSGDSIIFTFGASEISLVGDNDTLLEQNEVIEICYDVLIQSCEDIPSTMIAYWGCNQEFCEVATANANVIIQDAAPVLSITRSFEPNTCYGAGVSTAKLIVTNTGSGPATNVEFEIWIGYNTGPNNGLFSAIDTSNIMWVDTAGNATQLSATNILIGTSTGTYACRGPNPVLRATVTVPFMDIGEQDTLIFTMNDCCKNTCPGTGRTQRSEYRYSYQGVCDTLTFRGGPANVSSGTEGGVTSFAANGPSDLNPGDTAQYCIEHSRFRFFRGAPGGYAYLDLVLPPNLNFVNGSNALFFEDQQGDLWNSSNITIIGDTVRGRFNFPITGGVSLEKVNLKFSLTTNCAGTCDGGIESILYNLYQVPDTSCSCLKAISCFDFDVKVHCPGCPCPDGGFLFRNFTSTRDNFGLPDPDNDGDPDGTGPIDSSLVRMNYLMFGDTLKTVFYGSVASTAANPTWDGGYATSNITRGNVLTPIMADLEIFDASSGNTFTTPIALPAAVNIGGNDRSFTYDLDTNALNGTVPNGYVYDQGDSLILTVRYQVTINVSSLVQTQNITNDFSMTNTATGDSSSCDSYSGNFVLVGYYFTNCCLNQFSASGCNNVVVSQNYYLSIGNCCSNYAGGNIFKYEYRQWATMEEARFVLPPGYNFISATIQDIRTTGTQSTASTPQIPLPLTGTSSDTLIFDMNTLYQANGGPAFESDDGFYGIMRVTLQPNCSASEVGQRIFTVYEWDAIPQLTGPGSYDTIRTSYDSLRWRGPVITMTPSVQIAQGITSNVSWDFQIENSANVEDASNTWFAFTSASGQINPVSVIDVATGTALVPVNGIYQVGTVEADSIRTFRLEATYSTCDLDSILVSTGWNCPGYPANLSSAVCVNDADYLILDPQPSEIQATLNMPSGPFDICDSIPVEINILSSQLANVQDLFVNFLLPLTGGLEYAPGSAEFQYPSANGFASIPDPSVIGTQVRFDIDSISALIEANDLPGSGNPDSNAFTLRFVLTTDCDFASGRRFLVQVLGNRVCGDALPPSLLFSPPIDISGVVTAYSTAVSASAIQNNTCPDDQTLSISLVNTGLGTTAAGDSVFVDLNSGFSYAGNFIGGINPPANTIPVVQSFAGGTRLAWEMPPGLSLGDTISFDIDVNVSSLVACGTDIITVSSEVSSSLFCARTGTSCIAAAVTGSVVVNVPITRPDLQLNNFLSTIGPGPSGFEYTYSGTIENNGVGITPGTLTNVEFYCDSDQSGTLNAGDNLIGTYPTTVGINNGSPHNFNGTFNFNNTVCTDSNQIFAVIAPDTLNGYCLCDSAFANTNVVLPIAWLQARGEARLNGNNIHWEALVLNGHDYFQVEHQNGQAWEAVSPAIYDREQAYDWLHSTPKEVETYRVRAVDQNGQATLSSNILIDRSTLKSCRFFPNPTSDLVQLEGPAGTPFRIISLMGQEVASGYLEDGLTPVETNHFSDGVYLIEFYTESGTQSERLVVQ